MTRDLMATAGQRHIAIIGASRGLGRAVAQRMGEDGWLVTIGARRVDQLESVREELLAQGCQVRSAPVDVRDLESVRDFLTTAAMEFGAIRTVLHTAAKYPPFGNVVSVAPEDWTETISVNLVGTFHVLRAAAQAFRGQAEGNIIVLSGGGATAPMPSVSAYAASKAGVVRLVETFAREMDQTGVSAVALAPGLMRTRMLFELLEAGPDVIDSHLRARMVEALNSGEDSLQTAVRAISSLAGASLRPLSGRLISVVWDPWEDWLATKTVSFGTDDYTLRRQVPHAQP